jgi:hypothetical protein
MAKPTIVTRAGKGSALTFVEGDANFTNLQNATLTLKAGSGGTDVVSDLNGTLTLVAGTNVSLSGDNSAKTLTITASGGASSLDGLSDVTITGTPSLGHILRYTANNVFENVAAGYLSALAGDSSPQLGGNLNVNGNAIVSTSNGNIRIEPNGSGNIMITPTSGQIILGSTNYPTATPTSGQVLTAGTGGQLSWSTPSSGGIANVVEDTSPELGGDLDVLSRVIKSTEGDVILSSASGNGFFAQGDWLGLGKSARTSPIDIYTVGSQSLNFYTDNGAYGNGSPQIQLIKGANGNIVITPCGTGKTRVNAINYNEGTIYDLGTTGGTIAPNVTNGNVQKITLNSALTINAFTTPVAGQSLTLIIYGGTSYTSITSTMKFAGGIKTLTGTSGCIDILSVYYDGTTYFASLGKGFA